MPYIKIKDCLNCHVSHEWLFEGATLKEFREIKQLTGLNIKNFAIEAGEGDPDAIAALVYLLHKRDKITLRFDDVDLDLRDFEQTPTEEEKEEIAKLEAEMKRVAEENQNPKAAL